MSIHNIPQDVAETVERNLDNMVRFAFFRTGSRVFAEDLVHDAVIRLARAKTAPRDVRMYLFRILYNLCMDFRKTQRDTVTIEDIDEPFYSPDEENEFKDERQRVIGSLETLSDEKRQIVMMRAVDNLKFTEIEAIMSAPPTTVQSRYNAAIKELKTILNKSGDL